MSATTEDGGGREGVALDADCEVFNMRPAGGNLLDGRARVYGIGITTPWMYAAFLVRPHTLAADMFLATPPMPAASLFGRLMPTFGNPLAQKQQPRAPPQVDTSAASTRHPPSLP